MLKRDITYTDYNDEKVTDTFYFNITKSEVIELEVGHKGGLEEFIKKVIRTEDHQGLIAEFKRIILLAYGERSDDGKRFIKTQELKNEFAQTAAFDALFMELATSDGAAADFIKGVLPSDMKAEIEAAAPLPQPNIQPVVPKQSQELTPPLLPPSDVGMEG